MSAVVRYQEGTNSHGFAKPIAKYAADRSKVAVQVLLIDRNRLTIATT